MSIYPKTIMLLNICSDQIKVEREKTLIIEKCIGRYSRAEGCCDALAKLMQRICNAIKAIFGCSDWQKARKILSNALVEHLRAKDPAMKFSSSSLDKRANVWADIVLEKLLVSNSSESHLPVAERGKLTQTEKDLFTNQLYAEIDQIFRAEFTLSAEEKAKRASASNAATATPAPAPVAPQVPQVSSTVAAVAPVSSQLVSSTAALAPVATSSSIDAPSLPPIIYLLDRNGFPRPFATLGVYLSILVHPGSGLSHFQVERENAAGGFPDRDANAMLVEYTQSQITLRIPDNWRDADISRLEGILQTKTGSVVSFEPDSGIVHGKTFKRKFTIAKQHNALKNFLTSLGFSNELLENMLTLMKRSSTP